MGMYGNSVQLFFLGALYRYGLPGSFDMTKLQYALWIANQKQPGSAQKWYFHCPDAVISRLLSSSTR
jgi:hypothetical protein